MQNQQIPHFQRKWNGISDCWKSSRVSVRQRHHIREMTIGQICIAVHLLCFWYLWEKRYNWQSLLYIAVYSAMSSLVLCGFAWIIFLGLCVGVLILTKRGKEKKGLIFAFLEMSAIYLLFNISLVCQILGIGDSMVSHKSEYVLTGAGFGSLLKEYFINGGDHSVDYHKYILLAVICVGCSWVLCKRSWSETIHKWVRMIVVFLMVILALCAMGALWNCNTGIDLREKMGSLGSFQFGRVLWLAPAIWYVVLALCLAVLWTQKNRIRWTGILIAFGVLGIMGLSVFQGSSVKNCVKEMLLPEYETISWSDYFALGVMDQVEEYIYKAEGRELSEYRVVSLGIDPVAALYHGFYTLDGYSNNYDVRYKHAFREVIAPEIERNEWLKAYYDDWGNRCYLFSAEIPGYYNIEKGMFVLIIKSRYFHYLQNTSI